MTYRMSHVDRGDTYDSTLATRPFDAYMARWEARYAVDIARRLFPSKIPRYLDFACGTGRMTQILEPLARETVGIDVSPSMLRIAREKVPNAAFVEVDLTINQADLGQFDLASSFRFFGNAEQALRTAVLRALNRMLKMNAYLMLNNHRNPRALASALEVITGGPKLMDLTHAKLQRLLSDTGFQILESKPIAVWQYRSKLMMQTGRNQEKEERLERLFGAEVWVPIAPDAIVLARKTRELASSS